MLTKGTRVFQPAAEAAEATTNAVRALSATITFARCPWLSIDKPRTAFDRGEPRVSRDGLHSARVWTGPPAAVILNARRDRRGHAWR